MWLSFPWQSCSWVLFIKKINEFVESTGVVQELYLNWWNILWALLHTRALYLKQSMKQRSRGNFLSYIFQVCASSFGFILLTVVRTWIFLYFCHLWNVVEGSWISLLGPRGALLWEEEIHQFQSFCIEISTTVTFHSVMGGWFKIKAYSPLFVLSSAHNVLLTCFCF